MSTTERDYTPVLRACDAIPQDATRDERMGVFARALWEAIGDPTGASCSWLGFYVASGDEMLLVVREPKPACSPIGLHGACGRSLLEKTTLVVRDVASLGGGYVACDPRDVSELVIPCVDEHGEAWGVLDLDAFDAGAFTERDAASMEEALRCAGLTRGSAPAVLV